MPILAPSPSTIVVDNFSSSLYPVASFILRRNNTNKHPTTDPPLSSPTNHDEIAAASPELLTEPPTHQNAPTHTITHRTSTWAEVAKRGHPNPQHAPYSEGRGRSSKRRYRKRTTRRRAITANALSLLSLSPPLLSLSPSLTGTNKSHNISEQTKTTLRKIHKKHSNILIPIETNNKTDRKTEHDNTESQIERTLSEINNLTIEFDNTASRIEERWNTEPEMNITEALFYHEFILPIEATLQFELDDLNRFINDTDEIKLFKMQPTQQLTQSMTITPQPPTPTQSQTNSRRHTKNTTMTER